MFGRNKTATTETAPKMAPGTVKKWNSGTSEKGSYSWGFIDVGGKDVFAHGPTLGVEPLKVGQKVQVAFEEDVNPKTGKPGLKATKVVLA